VRELLQTRKSVLQKECASAALRAKCAGITAGLKARTTRDVDADVVRAFRPAQDVANPAWRARLTPYALAASLIVVVGGAFVYELTDRSVRVLAAELTADHVKCFGLNRLLGTHDAASVVEGSIGPSFAWPLHLPDRPGSAGLALVDVMGHAAAVWSVGDRTFVLIAREPRGEVERMASFVHAGLR